MPMHRLCPFPPCKVVSCRRCCSGQEQDWLWREFVKSMEVSRLSPTEGEKCTEPLHVPEVCQEIFSNDFTPCLCSWFQV